MSESRIIVTQKGRQLQKELSGDKRNENRVQFSPLSTNTKGPFRTKRSNQSLEKINAPALFGMVRSRSGYFGPKKLIKEMKDSMANYRPPYYPNYLRRSPDEYPSSHFEILTPEKILRDARLQRHIPVKPSAPTQETVGPIDTSALADERLPMRYVHHTIFPFTLPDKPSFLKQTNHKSASLMQSRVGFFENNSPHQRQSSILDITNRSTVHKVNVSEDFHPARMTNKNFRVDEFQKTMYSENNTVVTEHYSKQVVDKYDDRKLTKIRHKHSMIQRQFRDLLDVIEEKYQKRSIKVDENKNEIPEFQGELRRNEDVFNTRDNVKINENLRLIERLNTIQNQRYSNSWQKFQRMDGASLLPKKVALERLNPKFASRGGTAYNSTGLKRNDSWASNN